jgi:hypothetical protein
MSIWRNTGVIAMECDGDVSRLSCPNCGEDYLHHVGVVVFDRAEDAPRVTRTSIRDGHVGSHIVAGDGENPSGRRDGVVIHFTCEQCKAGDVFPMELRIAQHKGFTYLSWRYRDEPDDA